MQTKAIDSAALQQELLRILHSRIFERAHRSQRFLRYLVEAALADPPIDVKEYTVAIEVFDRDAGYNPAVDATVRVEASRLRSRLRDYYADEGRDDPWLIQLPKGAYSVVFSPRTAAESVAASSLIPPQTTSAEISPQPPFRAGHAASLFILSGWGRRRVAWVVSALLIFVITGVAIVWFRRSAPFQTAAPSAPISLAILPIVNHTGDDSLQYVVDGLTDSLIRQLSLVPALRMMGRATMFGYRNRTTDAEAIGKALHVDMVMTGELRRTPEHTLLAAEVTRVADGSVVLDREYIAEADDLRLAQADVQRDILAQLHLESSARDPGRPLQTITSNPEAYREFLKGDTLASTSTPTDMHEAMLHFKKAVTLDPQFDLAWSALARGHMYLSMYFESPRKNAPLARRYAQRALQINPSLSEAHGILGLVYLMYDWNLPAAQAEMSSADAEAAAVGLFSCTTHLIEYAGSPRTAEQMLRRALNFDPQSSLLIVELGCIDYYRGRYEAALRHYREALQVNPQSSIAFWGLGKTSNALGKYTEALEVLRSFRQRNGFEPPIITAEIGYALGASGQPKQAMEAIHTLSSSSGSAFVDPYLISIVYLSMNDLDDAFLWLNKALDARSSFSISILTEPKWQPFHDDPRFILAVERLLNKKS